MFFKCISLDSWEKSYLENKCFSCPYKYGICNQANLVNYSDLDKKCINYTQKVSKYNFKHCNSIDIGDSRLSAYDLNSISIFKKII